DAPGVVGRLAQVPAADLGAHPAVGAIAADDVLDVHCAFLTGAGAGVVLEPHGDGVGASSGVGQTEELDAVVRVHARGGVGHKGVEVVHDPGLVDQQVRKLAHPVRIVQRAGGAHDVAG